MKDKDIGIPEKKVDLSTLNRFQIYGLTISTTSALFIIHRLEGGGGGGGFGGFLKDLCEVLV